MATPQAQRSIPELLQAIADNLQEIIRSEFRLAKTEISEKATKASKPAATLGTGLLLGFYAVGFLLLALVYGLSTVVPAWLGALIVGFALAGVAAAMINASSKKLKKIKAVPDKTIATLEENVQWAKHPTK
jgi:protein-S-isoprenylcysteine O-methyltransferase Ste14